MELNIIELNGNYYGISTEKVRQVVGLQQVTPLPFAPDFVEGMVNIDGRVIAQIDMSIQLEQGSAMQADKGKLIIIDSKGSACALHIDQALMMVDIPDDKINRIDGRKKVYKGVSRRLLEGECEWDGNVVLILSAEQLGMQDIVATGMPDGAGGLLALSENNDDQEELQASQKSNANQRILIVGSGNEHYGIQLSQVRLVEEITTLTLLPQAPYEVLGLISLHDHPHLVLGLTRLLGIKTDTGSDANDANKEGPKKLVIIGHQGVSIGLAVDRIIGIEELQNSQKHQVILSTESELEGYMLDSGDRMIGLINIPILLSEERMNQYQRYMADDTQSQTTEEADVNHKLFMSFRVGDEQCALTLEKINRVVTYQSIDDLPGGGKGYLTGVVQIQGEVLPVVDLRKEFGVSCDVSESTGIIVAQAAEHRWALVVDQVYRVVDVLETEIEHTASKNQQYVDAIARINGNLMSVITLNPLLQDAA